MGHWQSKGTTHLYRSELIQREYCLGGGEHNCIRTR